MVEPTAVDPMEVVVTRGHRRDHHCSSAEGMHLAASAVSQIALRKLVPRSMMIVGAALFPIGLALTVVALMHPALWQFLTAAAIAGAGAGLLFKSGLGESAGAASPASRAGVLAIFFIISYLGMGSPSVLFALTIRAVPLVTAMIWFAAILTAATIVAVVVGTTKARRAGA